MESAGSGGREKKKKNWRLFIGSDLFSFLFLPPSLWLWEPKCWLSYAMKGRAFSAWLFFPLLFFLRSFSSPMGGKIWYWSLTKRFYLPRRAREGSRIGSSGRKFRLDNGPNLMRKLTPNMGDFSSIFFFILCGWEDPSARRTKAQYMNEEKGAGLASRLRCWPP